MTSPCLDPSASPYAKLREAIAFSEVNRADADSIIAMYRPEVERDLRQRNREAGRGAPSEREITVTTEIRAAKSTEFKNAMENERWGWRLALMYALEQLATQDTTITANALLSELVREVRTLRQVVSERLNRPDR